MQTPPLKADEPFVDHLEGFPVYGIWWLAEAIVESRCKTHGKMMREALARVPRDQRQAVAKLALHVCHIGKFTIKLRGEAASLDSSAL